MVYTALPAYDWRTCCDTMWPASEGETCAECGRLGAPCRRWLSADAMHATAPATGAAS